MIDRPCSRNRNDVLTFREHPTDGQLCSVFPSDLAYSLKGSTASMFNSRFGLKKRGLVFRKFRLGISCDNRGLSVRRLRPTGEKATKVVPSRWHRARSPSSGARVAKEYSDCTAATGPTDQARSSVVGAISDKPTCLMRPSS